MFETDKWPFFGAKFVKAVKGLRAVRLVVIHSMEAPEKGETAEATARYFATTVRPASAHLCIDNNSIVQCVHDNDIAAAAPGANTDGIHIELAGYARQTKAEWQDEYGTAMLKLAADAAAQYCLKYDIPVKHLSNDELRSGVKGIVGHYQVSAVYKKSTHTDPGDGFPWDDFIAQVEEAHAAHLAK